jgi:hypothetical protein
MPAVSTGSPDEKAARRTAFGLFIVAAVAIAACSIDSHSGPEQDNPTAWSYNAPVAAPATVFVRNTNGSIEIKPATGKNVEVTADVRWRRGDPKHDISFVGKATPNGILICAIWGDGSCTETKYEAKKPGMIIVPFSNGTDASVRFTVYVPTGVKVDIMTINGSIGAAATAPVKARTINGTIKVATSVGPVDAETVNGDVDVRMTTLSGDGPVRARAVTGSAAAYVPEKVDGTVEMKSVIGSTVSDFPGTKDTEGDKKFTATLGTGGRTIDIGTVTGSATLRKLKADGTVANP